MSIIDRLKQKREEALLKKISSKKATKDEIIKGFINSKDKEYFISTIRGYLDDDEIELINIKLEELCKDNKEFIINEFPQISYYTSMSYDKKKEIIMSELEEDEIVSNIEVFNAYGYDYDKLDLLKGINPDIVSPEIISSMPMEYQEKYILSIDTEKIRPEIIEQFSEESKVNIAKTFISNDTMEAESIKALLSDKILLDGIKEIVSQDATGLNDRCFEFIPEEKKGEIVSIAKMNYVLQQTKDEQLNATVEKMLSNESFMKYLAYRQDTFNTGENQEVTPRKTNVNENIAVEVLSSIKEYQANEELINEVINSNMQQDNKTKTLLKYYILDNETENNITNLDELYEYPKEIYKRETSAISTGDKNVSKDIIIRNLTGYTLEEYENCKKMFLDGHNIEDVLQEENKVKNIKILQEITNFIESMDDNQLKEFATNISTRNYNELKTGEFSLVNFRENNKSLISNIKSEYGKEFNQQMGYTVENTETKEINGKVVNINEISGDFSFLIHMTHNDEISQNSKKRSCMSFISEGHYDVATGDKCKSDSSTVFFVFDNIPEDLLYASSNSNMTSNNYGDSRSNFMTAQNTILKAEKDIEATEDNAPEFTEQTYFFEGFDKDGKFVKIYPKAIGTFEKEPSPKTLQVALKYGVDVIKIPEMQQNLERMLENGIVTPSLVKGIDGFQDEIIEVLSGKEVLSKDEMVSLEVLQQKTTDETILKRINDLLDKSISKENETSRNIAIDTISKETRQIINLIKSPEIQKGQTVIKEDKLLSSAIEATEETTRFDSINEQRNKIVQLQKERTQAIDNKNIGRE